MRRVAAIAALVLASTGCSAREWTAWNNVFGGQNVVLCEAEGPCDVGPGQRLDVLLHDGVTDWDPEWAVGWCDLHGGREVIIHEWFDEASFGFRYDVVCEGVDF